MKWVKYDVENRGFVLLKLLEYFRIGSLFKRFFELEMISELLFIGVKSQLVKKRYKRVIRWGKFRKVKVVILKLEL